MSWLSDLANELSGALGGPNLDKYLPDLPSLSGDNKSPSLWPSLITAGTGLLNSYYTQSSGADLAEQYAKQQQAALEAQLASEERKLAAQKEIAGMYSGATVKAAGIAAGAAKKNTLASIYNNWASLQQRAAESEGQLAQNIGGMIGRSLDARQASLK